MKEKSDSCFQELCLATVQEFEKSRVGDARASPFTTVGFLLSQILSTSLVWNTLLVETAATNFIASGRRKKRSRSGSNREFPHSGRLGTFFQYTKPEDYVASAVVRWFCFFLVSVSEREQQVMSSNAERR
jgi:hypothetical protein